MVWIVCFVWAACGLASAGGMNAYWRGRFPQLCDACTAREDLAQTLIFGRILGPVALIAAVGMTGLFYYGWTLSCRPLVKNDEKGDGME